MKGNLYLFIDMDSSKIVDRLKLANDKEAIKTAGQISKTINEQVIVFRGIAIVDERPSTHEFLMREQDESNE